MVLPETIRDSRRLTGPNLVTERPGAVLEVELPDPAADELVRFWKEEARLALAAVGWAGESLHVRRYPGGASLALTAPIDALYAATEVNEWAWTAATARFHCEPVDGAEEYARLAALIAEERKPALLALQQAADAHGLRFLWDDEAVSIGTGAGSMTWAMDALPTPSDVHWAALRNIPVALITGSNGKTTVTRLVSEMITAAGLVGGHTSTDGVKVGGELLETGDFSGPGGARRLLRDRRVELAVLETARGGLLRRGLAIDHADVALVTNIAEDHLGESAVYSLADLAEAKLVVARALGGTRPLVLNADDPALVAAGATFAGPIAWFSLDADHPTLAVARRRGRPTATVREGRIVLGDGTRERSITPLDRIPITVGGAARHNVANALAAALVGALLGLDDPSIATGLAALTNSPSGNLGRLNAFEFGGIRLFVDFAHNPHGVTALMEMAQALPATRRLVVIGQAGDRDDHAILELARTAWLGKPDRVLVKEMPAHLRGRKAGEVSGMLLAELRSLGARDDQLDLAVGELQATRQALGWARDGDLLLLTVHADRDTVLRYLQRLAARQWTAGTPLPE
ncbi:MAG TPA: Mur ligase family protein [Gemmatimonadales bacterium]|nr:Mur ligase family protein [Gemmatimonadales bacterium]